MNCGFFMLRMSDLHVQICQRNVQDTCYGKFFIFILADSFDTHQLLVDVSHLRQSLSIFNLLLSI
jgi:hypothetical protein